MIYLDNAATTWPKPSEVINVMQEAFISGGNPGRGAHNVSLQAARRIFRVRETLADFFGFTEPKRVVFTSNATQALNQALFGLLRPGDHVITSSLEHNAVFRPLWALAQQGLEITEVRVDPESNEFPLQDFEGSFKSNTKLVVTLHASNVTGTLFPVADIGRIARKNYVPYLVDAAQTAGVFPINMEEMNIDLLAFPGHKGLLGPQGTGGLIVREGIHLNPIMYGGTGSLSESDLQPEFFPDVLESGTLNSLGIAGLGAALEYLKKIGIEKIRKREQELCQYLIDGLMQIEGIKIYGGLDAKTKAPIVSFNLKDVDSTIVGYVLEQEAGIIARSGLHCAPHAHATLDTLKQGVVRLSPSNYTTDEEIDTAIKIIRQVATGL